VRDGDGNVANTDLLGHRFCRARQTERGFSAADAEDFDVAPADAARPTGAKGFHGGFFCGEAASVTFVGRVELLAICSFGGRVDAFDERRWMAFDGRFDAINFGDVET
jgi:hypothetical protein